MKIKVQNDDLVLHVSIGEFKCFLDDVDSVGVFIRLERMLLNLSGLYDMAYIELDTLSHQVSVYSQTDSDGRWCMNFPVFVVSVKSIMDSDSMLLKLYNLFVEKRHQLLFHDVNKG